jgi:capsular exopolysaccharide synthesis family protein
MEKTLIIGADLRRPTLANRIGLPPNAAGLAQLVAGTGELEDCVHHWEEGGIYVMPAGIIPSNPLEVLSSRRFVEALVQLKQRYDRIIVDSAPTHAVSDALVLASYADSLIYLVKADSTPFTMVRTGISRLVNSNAPFTGVVLNQVNLEKASKYYDGDHYYYTGYQSTYGYGESGQA